MARSQESAAALALMLTSVLVMCPTEAFNVDVVHPVIFRGPVTDPAGLRSRADTYFGFAVGLAGGSGAAGPELVVGAPRANSTLGRNPLDRVLEPGALFKCPLRRGARCQEVLVDPTGNQPGPGFRYTDLKNQSWLGGALDVEAGSGGRLAVCSHRWRNIKYSSHYFGNGACYQADGRASQVPFHKFVPLFDSTKQNIRLPETGANKRYYYYAYGQAGTSVHFPANGHELVMGAPGVLDWTGTLVRYSDFDRSGSGGNSRRRRQLQPLGNLLVPNPAPTPQLRPYDYLGYSVGSGRFFSSSDGTLYLSGAPRAAGGKGKVFLIDFPANEYESYEVLGEWVGSSLGEYFGAAVLAADLNGDGLSDVVVGAPMFGSGSAPEQGRVHVFLNLDDGLFRPVSRPLVGAGAARARFGTALAPLGDLDRDGFADLAVGAPYEDDGRGAVYVFRGGPGDFGTTPSQRIAARDLSGALRGFGVSVSRGVDVDGNGYPDLAVGSHASGDAVLLRSRPVVEFVASLTAEPNKLETSTTEFGVHACLSYRGESVPPKLDVTVTLKVESFHAQSAILVDDQYQTSVTFPWEIRKEKNMCRSFAVGIRSQGLIDYTKPVQMSMRYALLSADDKKPGEDATFVDTDTSARAGRRKRQVVFPSNLKQIDDFCTSCPVPNLNMANQRRLMLSVPFSVGCGEDAVCDTDLKLSYKFDGLSDRKYVIGSTPTLTLELQLENGAEPASLPTLAVDIPSPLSLVRVPPSCQERNPGQHDRVSSLLQRPPHPFYRDSHYKLKLLLDTSELTADVRKLGFNVSVASTGVEINPRDNVANITLGLVSQADMEIRGSSEQEQVFYDKEEDRAPEDRGQPNYVAVRHMYQILKYLPTPVKAVAISFLVPVNFTSGDEEVNFLQMHQPAARVDGQPFRCSVQDGALLQLSEDASREPDTAGRRRREAEVPAAEPPAVSDAHLINCTRGSPVRCALLTCQPLPFLAASTRATVTLDMRLDVRALRPLLAGGDRATLATQGLVQLSEGAGVAPEVNRRPDWANVQTPLLPSTLEPEPIAAWIIVVSVLAALALLALLSYLMYRAGFFRRAKRDQLLEERGDAERDDNLSGLAEAAPLRSGGPPEDES
ncbi:LOW QUALITY PROTEIN: integrin alpha-PS3-like [Pollicipes pollicipes]|uniref:LOW QUALITY PROTEIN: integrin alpha-PS3-like n=1 Tax=Pollicipes pollicipes TaxID=41117 RepID=UPI0018856868|nr:LOW QUALITY PROTEIN: integrin alpha-PS3-like [Pollicipes pollicipes]